MLEIRSDVLGGTVEDTVAAQCWPRARARTCGARPSLFWKGNCYSRRSPLRRPNAMIVLSLPYLFHRRDLARTLHGRRRRRRLRWRSEATVFQRAARAASVNQRGRRSRQTRRNPVVSVTDEASTLGANASATLIVIRCQAHNTTPKCTSVPGSPRARGDETPNVAGHEELVACAPRHAVGHRCTRVKSRQHLPLGDR